MKFQVAMITSHCKRYQLKTKSAEVDCTTLGSSSCGYDVVSRSSIFLNGWARMSQPPCQTLVRSEQTPNSIWMVVYGTRCNDRVCLLFLCTTLTDAGEAMPHCSIYALMTERDRLHSGEYSAGPRRV